MPDRPVLRRLVPGLAALLLGSSAHAGGFVADASLARYDGRNGGEVAVGYGFDAIVFTIRPMIGAVLSSGPGNDFREIALPGGLSACLDIKSAQPEREEVCAPGGLRVFGRLEAVINLPLLGELGAGARLQDGKVRPYGTVALSVLPLVKVKANIGNAYAALGLQAGF